MWSIVGGITLLSSAEEEPEEGRIVGGVTGSVVCMTMGGGLLRSPAEGGRGRIGEGGNGGAGAVMAGACSCCWRLLIKLVTR